MDAAMKKPTISMRTFRYAAAQGGFSLIEVMISVAILTIGSIGLLGVFGLAVKATQTTQEDMVSRQLAAETMESIYTARNSAEIGWPAIANVSNGGIFVDGLQNIKCAGPDGILDTADDASCLTASGATCPNGGIECLTEPGPDGVLGTADDVVLSLANYQRQVQILPLYTTGANPTLIQTLAQVSITIQYTPPSQSTPKQYVLNEYVSAYH
jgi:prepilin-type N-terminal cleavage/methylation domain-containing protein